jgi:hypothetical protein
MKARIYQAMSDSSGCVCPEKQRLLNLRVALSSDSADAARDLRAHAGKNSARFAELYRIAEVARIRAESARHQYELHVGKHGC